MALLINLSFATAAWGSDSKIEKAAKLAERIKTGIAKLGTGPQAKVEVTLKDGTKLKGYVSSANETSFLVIKNGTTEESVISYSDAKKVKGNNLSTGAKIAIGVGIFIVVAVILAIATRSS